MLGFCLTCFRVRYLARVTAWDRLGNPSGVCTQCDREEQEAKA